MLMVQICVGSSCHLKGSPEIVELFQRYIAEYKLEDEVLLSGSFCIGRCNREGVTIQINDDVHVGVSKDNFKEFFDKYILSQVAR
jgi:NADH:ubiquinone oxidoreductase subunit E